MDRVPAALAEVIEPLREADEYRTFQLQRQRGVYNLLTGLPGLFFVLWIQNGLVFPARYWQGGAFVQIGAFALFLLSCGLPRILLPWVQRRKPDWREAFLEASFLKQALEKLFWLQAILAAVAFILLLGLLLGTYLTGGGDLWVWVGLALFHAASMAGLALQARRMRDHLVETLFWLALPLAAVNLLGLVGSLDPLELSLRLLVLGLVVPPILAASIRLLAPRRWLVR